MTDVGTAQAYRPMGTQPRRVPRTPRPRLRRHEAETGSPRACPSHEGVPTASRVQGASGPPHGQAAHPVQGCGLFMGSDRGGRTLEVQRSWAPGKSAPV